MNAAAKSYSVPFHPGQPDSVPDDESMVALELVVDAPIGEPKAAILAREIAKARRMVTELRELIVSRQAEVDLNEELIHRSRHTEAFFRSSMMSSERLLDSILCDEPVLVIERSISEI